METVTKSEWNNLSAWEQVKRLEKHGELRVTYHNKPLYDVRLPKDDVSKEQARPAVA